MEDVDCIYTSNHEPDPYDAVDVLAFVLCPLTVFAPTGDADELEVAKDLIGPAKEEAVERFLERQVLDRAN